MASLAQEFGRTVLGEHVVEALRRHVARLQREEAIEQAIDVGGARRRQVAIAVELLQLALLAAQARTHRGGEGVLERIIVRAREGQMRAYVDGCLVRQQRERICDPVPGQRLIEQRDEVDAVLCDPCQDVVQGARRHRRDAVAPPKADVEVRVLRSQELHARDRARLAAAERPQQQWLAVVVEAGDDERCHAQARTDVPLPGREQVEALVGGRERVALLEAAPVRLRRRQVAEDLHARDRVRTPPDGGGRLLAARAIADGDVHLVFFARLSHA